MSETILVFLLGLPLLSLSVTIQGWIAFQSTDKHKEARITLISGIIITLTLFLIVAYFLGWFTKPAQIITEILNIKIGVTAFVIWTVFLLIFSKVVRLIVGKITTFGVKPVKPATNNSSKKKPQQRKKARSKFNDLLKTTLVKWHTVSGNPQISTARGTPNPPSLLLEENPGDSRHTFVLAQDLTIKSGRISCEIYLEREAVFNLVFRANSSASEFYMARVDSRSGGSNGFLIARNSRSWTYIKQPNNFVLNDQWHHVELKLDDSRFELSINNDEPIIVEDTSFPNEGRVGMFNELKRVFVNKFVVE